MKLPSHLFVALMMPCAAVAQDAKPPATDDDRSCVLAAAHEVRVNLRLEPLEGRIRLLRKDELPPAEHEKVGYAKEVEIDATSVRIPVTYLFVCIALGDPPVARVRLIGHRSAPPK